MTAVIGSYAVVTLLVCSPFVSVFNLGATPVMDGDVALYLWTLSWVNHALRHQPLEIFQANTFHPHPDSLSFSEHFFGGALLVFPWYSFSDNPVYPYNLLFLASYLLSAITMYFLAFHYTRHVWASWLAGLIYDFCFFRAHHFTHLGLIFNPWIPMVILSYERLAVSFQWRRCTAFLFFAVLQCWPNWYAAFSVVLISGWRLGSDLIAKRLSREKVAVMVSLLLCTALLILPFYLPYAGYHDAPGALDEVRYNSANVGSYFQPPLNTFLGQWLKTESRWIWGERSTYSGYVVLLPLLLGFWLLMRRGWKRENRYLFLVYSGLGLFAFLVSLGPYFLDLGGLVSPSRVLYWVVPPLQSLRAIARLAIVVTFCLALLVSLVLSRFKPRTSAYLVPILGLLFLFEHYPVGLPWNPREAVPFQPRAVDVWLKQEASEQKVLVELPGYSPKRWTRESSYILYSTQHWLKLVNGYTRFYPDGYFQDQETLNTFPSAEALELLKRYGVDYVVVHSEDLDPEQLHAIENDANLVPAIRFGKDLVFTMNFTKEENGVRPRKSPND